MAVNDDSLSFVIEKRELRLNEMATLRVRFKLNPGRKGISLSKLSKQTENIELFLRSLASDLGVDDSTGLWLASNFKNGSLIYTPEYQAPVERDMAFAFNDDIYDLVRYQPSKNSLNPSISHATIDRFARLRESLDADEKIGIGIIDIDTAKIKWKFVNRLQLEEIGNSVETEVLYLGSVMGYTYEWNKGAANPYLNIREIATGDLVKCVYRDDDYDKVAKLFQKQHSIVTIYGTVKLNRITEKYEVINATDFEVAPDFSNDDYEKFFGCAPDFTNDLSSAEFVAKGRSSE